MPGISYTGNNLAGMGPALLAAADADAVILTLGGKNGWGSTSTIGEGVDSTEIDLPGHQEEFAREVFALHRPTVVVHFDGRPLSNEFTASHFDAIIEAWQLGEHGGQALASVIFGDYDPAGRLPVTAARCVGQIPVYYSLPRGSGYISAGHTGMIRNPNGYVDNTAFPLYPFGHGLSYTQFDYSDLKLSSHEVASDGFVEIRVDITNVGPMDGDEVVQLYVSDDVASMVRPSKELAGFARVSLKKGEKKTVSFTLQASQLAFLDKDMNWLVESGKYHVMVGASSEDLRLSNEFIVTGDKIIDGWTRSFYARAKY